MYSEEENTPRIVEVEDNKLGFDSDLKNGLVDPYLKLVMTQNRTPNFHLRLSDFSIT